MPDAPLSDKEPAVYDLQGYERATIDPAVHRMLPVPEVQTKGFLRTDRRISRRSKPASRKIVEAATGSFNGNIGRATVDGRFYRDAVALREAIVTS